MNDNDGDSLPKHYKDFNNAMWQQVQDALTKDIIKGLEEDYYEKCKEVQRLKEKIGDYQNIIKYKDMVIKEANEIIEFYSNELLWCTEIFISDDCKLDLDSLKQPGIIEYHGNPPKVEGGDLGAKAREFLAKYKESK